MKKCFILLLLLSAQQLIAKDRFGPKAKVGLVFSPDISYRKISSKEYPWIVSLRDQTEIPRLGFTTGISYVYGFGRFALESGLQYSSKGFQSGFKDVISNQPGPEIPTEVNFIDKYNYLDAPLKLICYFHFPKVNFFISTGASANVLLQYQSVMELKFEDGSAEREVTNHNKSNFNRVNYAAMASLGIEFPIITQNVRFRIEPIYRQSITSFIDGPVKGYLNSAGLNAGIFVGI